VAKDAVLGNNLVDKLLPTVGALRSSLFASMGVRQFRVFVVRTSWDGGARGVGVSTATEHELTPAPQVTYGLSYRMEPCGLDEAGWVRLREVDLRYTEGELDGGDIPANETFHYRIEDGQGQAIRSRTFTLAKPPFPDREKDIGWEVHLRPTADGD
jgi:hypothetical protein